MTPGPTAAGRAWALFAASAVIGVGAAAWPYAVDDAYVLARYAARILAGDGYTMNPGPPTDGVTGPLALVPALLGQLVARDPLLGSKAVGLAAAALSAALVTAWAARESVLHAAVTALGVGLTPFLGVWAVAGLETGLATLAFSVAALATASSLEDLEGRDDAGDEPAAPVASGGARRAALVGGSVGLLAWLRPELAPAALVLLLAVSRTGRRAALIAWTLGLTGALGVVGFRLALFGSPLPLSAAAKPSDLAHGARYALRAALLAFGGVGLPLVVVAARESGGARRILALALGAHVAAVVLAGGDWMPGFRLFVPVLPVFAWLVAGAIAPRLAGRARWVGRAMWLGVLLIPAAALAIVVPDARAIARSRAEVGEPMAAWLRSHARRVALVDVGFLAYRSGVEVIDLGGITDPSIGRLPGDHVAKQLDPGLLEARAPDAIVLHSSSEPRVEDGRLQSLSGHPVERQVAAMAFVRAEFRVARVDRWGEGYWYVTLSRARGGSRRTAIGGTLGRWSMLSPPASSWRPRRCGIRASCAPWCSSSSTATTAPSGS